jgi:hypothetical protein
MIVYYTAIRSYSDDYKVLNYNYATHRDFHDAEHHIDEHGGKGEIQTLNVSYNLPNALPKFVDRICRLTIRNNKENKDVNIF